MKTYNFCTGLLSHGGLAEVRAIEADGYSFYPDMFTLQFYKGEQDDYLIASYHIGPESWVKLLDLPSSAPATATSTGTGPGEWSEDH